MKDAFLTTYECLDAVFRKRAFSGAELNNALTNCTEKNRPLVTKLFYNTLDLSLKYDYILSLYAKKIKPSVATALKMGLCAAETLNIPQAVVVNEIVDLVRKLGKSAMSGFVNAVLRRTLKDINEGKINYGDNPLEAESLKNGFPLWAAHLLEKDFGTDAALKFVSHKQQDDCGHIRYNPFLITANDFEELLKRKGVCFQRGPVECGYFVKGRLKNISSDLFTFQSVGSMAVALVCAATNAKTLLDLCAAPGGKSIFFAQLSPNSKIVSCDVLPHRVELIKKYAVRMGVDNIDATLNDATIFNKRFENFYDCVLCDVPCSGFGVLSSKPDIKLFRQESDLEELNEIQLKILNTSAKYVKIGGALVYSTCTVFKKENDEIIDKFLSENSNFIIEDLSDMFQFSVGQEKCVRFLPFRDGVDGFFITRLKKIN